ncbi:hypothetical protein ACIGZJ_14955 [Kitasatospora sp. NPDC052868]|uniref:hypothetical protein n=1 Tax=Kitasatospora sp. NPDC052868 TaxID=3364060 RepID=UPI0037CB8B57
MVIKPPASQDVPSGFDPVLENPPIRFGVFGDSNVGPGVLGCSGRTAGDGETRSGAGVLGVNIAVQGVGVEGVCQNGTGVLGEGGADGAGVSGTADRGPGVSGRSARGPGVSGTGVTGPGVSGASRNGVGVEGVSDSSFGVRGVAGSGEVGSWLTEADVLAVFGQGRGAAHGVLGTSGSGVGAAGASLTGVGIVARGAIGIVAQGDQTAGEFNGDVQVNGTMTTTGGGFRIDHPTHPEERFLAHSLVESPERKNLYDGTATLDDKGEATVTLPDWFAALNSGLCYQLTPLDGPAPNLHVVRHPGGDGFTIRGGVPQGEVCWLVTGVREDAWAKANPLVVEVEKAPGERGRLLHPEAYGRPPEQGIPALRQANGALPGRDGTR